MSTVRELHDRATKLAQLAVVARHEGRLQEARDLAREALDHEVRAAGLVPSERSSEPTRSILYLSAASLAYQCTDLQTALRLAADGLSGYPPPDVEGDLKSLLDRIDFERYLESRGAVLEEQDLEVSLSGSAVGSGMVIYEDFRKIIQRTIDLVHRTVERRMGRQYRRGSGRPSEIYRPFIPALSAARHGSFAVTLRLGVDQAHQASYLISAPQVIKEILRGIELINAESEEMLDSLIPDNQVDAELYRRHFISSTRDMAPDGERITCVGFTSQGRSVALTRLRSAIRYEPEVEGVDRQVTLTPMTMTGVLDHALSREQRGIERKFIEVNPEVGSPKKVIVEEGMIDVVRSYFGQAVEVEAVCARDDSGSESIFLRDIRATGDLEAGRREPEAGDPEAPEPA